MEKTKGSNRVANWFKGLKVEFKKVIWPDNATLTRQTVAVVVTSVIVGLLIALIDVIVQNGVDLLINLKF